MTTMDSMSSVGSGTDSLGSTTIDAPRKRHEARGRLQKLGIFRSSSKGSVSSKSKAVVSQPDSSKPPRVVRSYSSDASSTKPSVLRGSPSTKDNEQKSTSIDIERTNSSPSPVAGRPPIPKPSSMRARMLARRRSFTKATDASKSSDASKASNISKASNTSKASNASKMSDVSKTSSVSKPSIASKSSNASKSSKVSKNSETTIEPVKNSSGRRTYHVRVSLGYMTGIKMEASKKKKNSSRNIPVFGYAALAKSGKKIALSQPVGTNIDETNHKPIKMFWATPKGAKETSTGSKSKRRLHFAVKLEREDELSSKGDDDSNDVFPPCHPEVVGLVLGLKCGDEMIPLGFANLVITGKESKEQKIDIAVRSATDNAKKSIFSKRHHGISFQDNDKSYRLAHNATLHVRVDIKAAKATETKASIWGEGDDVSYATDYSFETKGTINSIPRSSTSRSLTTSQAGQEYLRPSRSRTGSRIGDTSSYARSFNSEWAEASKEVGNPRMHPSSGSYRGNIRLNVPVKFVEFDTHADAQSLASDLTMPGAGFAWSLGNLGCCFQGGWCGEEQTAPIDPLTNRDVAFEHSAIVKKRMTPMSGEKMPEMVPVQSGSESSDSMGQLKRISEMERRDDTTNGETKKRSSRDNDKKGNSQNARRSKQSEADDTDDGNVVSEDGETVDITVDTYSDLKGAQATLMRYASKAGVSMEELLRGIPQTRKV